MRLLAAFTGNATWFGILLTVHVFGAVVGLGPSFTFAIIGPFAGKQQHPPAGLALLEVMEKIEKAMVIPILIGVQLTTGILLIFNRGLNHSFFSSHNAWLVAGIGVYLVAMFIALGVNTPALTKSIRLAKEGKGGSPEFTAAIKIQQTFGPVLTLLGLAIIVLMAWKPGSGCGALYRC